MPEAVGYLRVSTERQAHEGVSLSAQEAKIRAWCKTNNYSMLALHTDAGLSGIRADNRPGLQAALNEVCKGKAVLVVYSLSRLARSTKDAILISERLNRAGADLVSLSERIDTTSASGKMVFRLLAVLAEFERDLISERIMTTLAHLKSQGRRVSGLIPYGFDLASDGRTLSLNKHEQTVIRRICQLRAKGQSLRQIAAILNKDGILSKLGKAWSAKAIRSILLRAS
jgi:DNA invertase Pin-like site-specific DNA recombinase